MTVTMKQLLKKTEKIKVSSPIVVSDRGRYRHIRLVETFGNLVVITLEEEGQDAPQSPSCAGGAGQSM